MTGNRESADAVGGEQIDDVAEFRRCVKNSLQRLRRPWGAAFKRTRPTLALTSIIPATG